MYITYSLKKNFFNFFLIFINGKVKVFSLSAINFQD